MALIGQLPPPLQSRAGLINAKFSAWKSGVGGACINDARAREFVSAVDGDRATFTIAPSVAR